MRKIFVIAITVSIAVSAISAVSAKGPKAPAMDFVEEMFVDYKSPSHAGPGPHPTSESDDFSLTMGGMKWSDAVIKYSVSAAGCADDCAGAVSEVNGSFDVWELGVLTFTQDNDTPDINPCTGTGNSVSWAAIDGDGRALAFASVCRNLVTKEIVGFRIVYDSGDTWSDSGDAGKLDIRNVGTHEAGHVVGLGHTNKPASGCLTMYNFAGDGETQKQTLGLGDKLGMDFLYATGVTGAGPGCGS